MTPGQFALRFYFTPQAYLRWVLQGGMTRAVAALGGEAAMERAVTQLRPKPPPTVSEALPVLFMTGSRFWHQTAFCAHSLATQLPAGLVATFQDDGSLTPAQAARLVELFPGSTVSSVADADARVETTLPSARFPMIHETRDQVVLFRKLTDLRAGITGWHLFLDSDMLFFGRPEFLESCRESRATCYMIDSVFGYCLDEGTMTNLIGCPVLPRVNTGILGVDNATIPWEQIESWLAALPTAQRRHRLIEQTFTAMLLSGRDAVSAPESDYAALNDPLVAPRPGTILCHYIQNAKWLYFAEEWRRYLRSLP